MKRFKKGFTGLFITLLTFSLLILPGGFSSKVLAETHAYDGKAPSYNNCDDSAVTKKKLKITNDDGSYANLELRFSTTCKTAWAKITLSRPAKSDGEATALVVRSTDNKQYGCHNSGGNGEVNKGQTSCYTPMVYDLDPRKAKAVGFWPYTRGETDWY
ncbi:DUF2690 domain-containing protein [Fictibacillus enclensis]|uniref:DUF2690 domain-containing protein n=1 Tax=Fictibacillus enclensis TaxID=1017270 RepID=UPI0024C0D71D|nr:DUF2690 domain-containing protein [Fictibacillus enclensis]MDM5338525.1 DUF2690 domain-containing protein [Fictibacillus enclensis]WHY74832.1 DUF2690 domain-containing protein [Fictibacillus enclensis]